MVRHGTRSSIYSQAYDSAKNGVANDTGSNTFSRTLAFNIYGSDPTIMGECRNKIFISFDVGIAWGGALNPRCG
jgi:hypothetical protein